jgi:hypothetical protein
LQSQVDHHLAAMVNHVIHREAAYHRNLGHGEKLFALFLEFPGCHQLAVAAPCERRPRLGDIFVEDGKKRRPRRR